MWHSTSVVIWTVCSLALNVYRDWFVEDLIMTYFVVLTIL